MFFQRCQVGRFQGVKIGIADVSRLVVHISPDQPEQCVVAVQGQTRQLNDVAVGKTLSPPLCTCTPYLRPKMDASKGNDLMMCLCFMIFLQKKKPFKHCGSKGFWYCDL